MRGHCSVQQVQRWNAGTVQQQPSATLRMR